METTSNMTNGASDVNVDDADDGPAVSPVDDPIAELANIPQLSLISRRDLANILKVSVKTVDNWRLVGVENVRLRCRSINGWRVGFHPDDVKRFFKLIDKRRGFTK